MASSCSEPVVPIAMSELTPVVTATPLPPTATPTPLPTSTPEPEPTVDPNATPTPTPTPLPERGISEEQIRVAIIYDDLTGGTMDGIFADAFDGINAWRSAVNFQGGINGRKIELVAFDARLSNHRQILEQICDGDFFAIIGSQSFNDFDGAELYGAPECRIADFAGEVYGAAHAASAVTFLSNPYLNNVRQAGPAKYLLDRFPSAAQKLALFNYTSLQLQNESLRQREMLSGVGLNPIFTPAVDLNEDLTDLILPAWKEKGVDSIVWTADSARLIQLLTLLKDDPPAFVLCEMGCYSERFIAEGGEVVEGVYAWVPYRPFDSEDGPSELDSYKFWLNEVAPGVGPSDISLKSWMAGRLFEQAMLRLSENETQPTREGLISSAAQIDAWDGRDVLSFTNPAAGEPTSCFALVRVTNGEWKQVYPDPPVDKRDLDCSDENLFRLSTTSTLGVTENSSVTFEAPTPSPTVGLDDPGDLETPKDVPD